MLMDSFHIKMQILMKPQPQVVILVLLGTNRQRLVRNLQLVRDLLLSVVMIFKLMMERNTLKRLILQVELRLLLMILMLRQRQEREKIINLSQLETNMRNLLVHGQIIAIVPAMVKMVLLLSVCRPILPPHQVWRLVQTLSLEKVPLVRQPSVPVHPWQRMQRQQSPSVWVRKLRVITPQLPVRLRKQKNLRWLQVIRQKLMNLRQLSVIVLRRQPLLLLSVKVQCRKKCPTLPSVKGRMLKVNRVRLPWVQAPLHKDTHLL